MSEKQILRKFNRILKKIKDIEPGLVTLTNKELKAKTDEFRARIKEGETLDDLLPEAFAVVCEADRRILGMHPYDVQIIGGIGLHKGYMCEMATGEGKTLTATMPLYLNALEGKGCLLLTTNDYLARRDAEEMGPVYEFLGLTIAAGVSESPEEKMDNDEKRAIYACDIVYSTHGVLGFDYLFNNLVKDASDRFLREFNYIIMDEADSVLLDSAQMPLVIAGSYRVQSNLYELSDFFVSTLKEGVDYEKEEKKVWLTEKGIKYAEDFFRIDNFYDSKYFEINRHVNLALRAHTLFEYSKDYMIDKKGELVLLDGGSGRMMPGVKLRGGLHQAIEVKEKQEASRETKSVASITYQNLFNLFPKIAGMSGTISDAAAELKSIYGVDVLVIPTNKPKRRRDLKDTYFRTKKSEYDAVLNAILRDHRLGRPVLAVASSIFETEYISRKLIDEHVPHNVLNANNAAWEAEIIKEAGQKYAVTIATSMAGRGTDIKLGEGVAELGGLTVIGVGRMPNVRLERQARGRSGRQGDPGVSRFFVSLEDEVVSNSPISGADKYINSGKRLSYRKLVKLIDGSRGLGEENAVSSRRSAFDYDVVLQRQRKLIYDTRNNLLDGGTLSDEQIEEIVEDNISLFIKKEYARTQQSLNRYILDNISYRLPPPIDEEKLRDRKYVKKYLTSLVKKRLEERMEEFGDEDLYYNFLRITTLEAIDGAWVDEVDYLQQLQAAVSGRSSAQRKPLYEYQLEAYDSFVRMKELIRKDILRFILLSSVKVTEEGELSIVYP